ncbi:MULTISPECIES: SurA N-terminal domain-containing protein [unclassified Methylophilus]|uniref:SurA N-terminal domain-containing protein n=1 Tax=unclassified Methylophilus TaxID=2630143 RepID=UPI0006FFB5CA|nr:MULTISPECIES: SurA N-terminal domain-containing protein [unclassified Methylophilus]KQT43282.1 peptidylprolyl isomerase [Methylophilus sp. Leaf416]KQT58769.1 peptidylprolyl isomerase [Methylophilus sp. Leaf459]
MLEALRKHTQGWMAKIILALIVVPFALFGIDSYLNNAGGQVAVAKVDGQKISLQEYSNAVENARNYLQSQGQKVDAALLESPAFKQSVLDSIITRRLVEGAIQDYRFKISDDQLSQHVVGMPEFQSNGKFSEDTYNQLLSQNKLTPAKFEQNIRKDLTVQQVRDGLTNLVFMPQKVAEQSLMSEFEQREVSVADIKVVDFINQVTVTPEQVQAYYNQHKTKFIAPAKVKLQFTLLSAAGLVGDASVSDEEVKQDYEENAAKYQGDEQRQASHILIGFNSTASAEEKAAAKQKAESILKQVKENPKNFEKLAIEFSQDTGSASKGGDLGSFGRGAMVKPFENAAFSMKVGEISDLVESEFGYHIIKLTGITGQSSDFDSMKLKIKAELLFQKAQAKYAELADDFGNTVYEQSGSLEPVAKKFNLQVQTSPAMTKDEIAKFFKSDRLASMVFSDEVLKEKRNTEAVEISPNNLVAARAVEYTPEAPRTFDEVKSGIESLLKAEAATKLAKQKGEALLAELKAGKAVNADWIPPVTIDRRNAQGLTDAVMRNVFKVNTHTLPAYYGFNEPNKGYTVIKVIAVNQKLKDSPEVADKAYKAYQAALGSEMSYAYVSSLKAKKDIQYNTKVLLSNSNN